MPYALRPLCSPPTVVIVYMGKLSTPDWRRVALEESSTIWTKNEPQRNVAIAETKTFEALRNNPKYVDVVDVGPPHQVATRMSFLLRTMEAGGEYAFFCSTYIR